MGLINWDNSLSIGLPDIDRQHRELADILNDVYEAMSLQRGRQAVTRALAHLVDKIQCHFADEEQFMIRYHFPGLPEHKKLHDALTQQIVDVMHVVNAGRTPIGTDLLTFLRDWLCKHIKEADMDFGMFIAQKRAA